ncbi:MAG: type II toxin-antitoxin system Phd/YefM family antitoxin [Thermoanaerobaculia bacterium]|nr:type II toxin-antitoxin system Phd/YefM family antitoxin [Thermoanaerobaculia bacterium]
MRRWQLQDAKAKLSEVIKCTQREGPQLISVRGEPAVVVISRDEYDRLRGPKLSLVEFLRQSPLMGLDLDPERDPSPAREVEL